MGGRFAWAGCGPSVVGFVLDLPSVLRLTEPDRLSGIKSHHSLLWSRNARLDTADPVRLASPAGQTGDPGPDRCVKIPAAVTVRPESFGRQIADGSLRSLSAVCLALWR